VSVNTTAKAPRRVGIEKIWAYPCTMSLDLFDLARARNHDPDDLRDNLLVRRRSLNPTWEDPVTMAVNAAKPMLTDEDRRDIELLIVATESSVDQSKSISTFAQRHLEISPNCRNYEAKHACYGGTAAVMMAAHWVATGLAVAPKKALVITTDQSRKHFHQPYEYVMGAGAVALLISDQPRVLEFELEHNGYWTEEVSDTFRPTSKVETGNGPFSLYCYIDALEGAYRHFLSKAGSIDFDSYFKKNIYHVPFGGISFQAHRTLLRQWRRLKRKEVYQHFLHKSFHGLRYNAEMGGTYSGSTFLALMGIIDSCDDLHPGDRIGIFSYGSGSCGEFYSGVLGSDAHEIVAAARLQELIDMRRQVTVDEYENIESERYSFIDQGSYRPYVERFADHYAERYAGQGLLVLKGVNDYYRDYEWS